MLWATPDPKCFTPASKGVGRGNLPPTFEQARQIKHSMCYTGWSLVEVPWPVVTASISCYKLFDGFSSASELLSAYTGAQGAGVSQLNKFPISVNIIYPAP